MARFAVSMNISRDHLRLAEINRLQITNNVRQLAYHITDVTRPQTHRIVCL